MDLRELKTERERLEECLRQSAGNGPATVHLEYLLATHDEKFAAACMALREKPEPLYMHERKNGVEVLALKIWRDSPRLITGTASRSKVNSHNYMLVSAGCTVVLPTPLLCNHLGHDSPIGTIVRVEKHKDKIDVVGRIFENNVGADHAWKLIVSGELAAFSAAATPESLRSPAHVDGIDFYATWQLREISIARKGACPDCGFTIFDGVPASSAASRTHDELIGESAAAHGNPVADSLYTV